MGDEDYGRDTAHNDNAFWESTGLYCWNRVMVDSGMTFENIGWEDIEGDNSVSLMNVFRASAKNNPPPRQDGKGALKVDSILSTFSMGVKKLKDRFRAQIRNDPTGDYFPEEVEKDIRKKIKGDYGRSQMEGADDSDLFKGTYPLPRKHNEKTLMFPLEELQTS